MGTLAPRIDAPRAVNVWFERGMLHVALEDGREIGCPLARFPLLAAATAKERATWEFTGKGEGIYWPAMDEDLSARGLLEGKPATQPEPALMLSRGAFLRAARPTAASSWAGGAVTTQASCAPRPAPGKQGSLKLED